MIPIKTAFMTAALLALASGPALGAPASPAPTADTAASASRHTLHPGALMYISQPTAAGHEWRLEPFNGSVLTAKAQPGQTTAAAQVRGEETEWLFEGGTLGTTELVFTYRKSGEPEAPALQTVRYAVEVK